MVHTAHTFVNIATREIFKLEVSRHMDDLNLDQDQTDTDTMDTGFSLVDFN